jgi:hypothetical protein
MPLPSGSAAIADLVLPPNYPGRVRQRMRALLPQTRRRHAISRYFFHVFDGQDLPDLVGTELTYDAAAKAEAIVTAGTMLSEVGSRFWDGENG